MTDITISREELEAMMLRQADVIGKVYEDAYVKQVALLQNKIGLNGLLADVKAFHTAFGHPVANKPTMVSSDRIENRAKWTTEEVQEMVDARTLVDQVDACIDQIYFAVGTLVELGVEPQPFWDIVQAANMAKLGPDGKPLYHADGKTRKPEGWEAPEPKLAAEVVRQLANSN